jgi:enoyl-CoA hydratase
MASVLYRKEKRIAYVTLNHPDTLNAIDDAINQELSEIWQDFNVDPEVDVAIVSGAGKAFCAGADFKTLIPKWEKATMGDLRANAVGCGLGGGITRGQHRIFKPIIAAVNGHAVGAGFELALACDIRIAADTAKFGVFEIRSGLHQGDGGLVRLVALAGIGVALDLTLTGRVVSAQEAYRLGLVTRVVPSADLLTAAEEYAATIISNPQHGVRSAKETIMEIVGRTLDDALRLESLYGYSSVGNFGEVKKRIEKFMEKTQGA